MKDSLLNKRIINKHNEIARKKRRDYEKKVMSNFFELGLEKLEYSGKRLSFYYSPLFFSEESFSKLNIISLAFCALFKKIYLLLDAGKIEEFLPYSEKMLELIKLQNGYEEFFPIMRFDYFYDFETEKFCLCEINTDGSSGMSKSYFLDKIFSDTEVMSCLHREYIVTSIDGVNKLIDMLCENYRRFSGGKKPSTVAIVDVEWQNQGMINEFIFIRDRLKKRGIEAYICSPEELRRRNKKLLLNGIEIDLIYRRAVTSDLINNIENAEDFIRAVAEKEVCLIGGFSSQLLHNKFIFALLYQEKFQKYLSEAEKDLIKRYVPYTIYLGKDIDLGLFQERKNDYLLKPVDSYQSKGIIIGRDVTEEIWRESLEGLCGKEYLLQSYVEMNQIKALDIKDGFEESKDCNLMLGMFYYNREFSGFYTRMSEEKNISSLLGARNVANYIFKEKEKIIND